MRRSMNAAVPRGSWSVFVPERVVGVSGEAIEKLQESGRSKTILSAQKPATLASRHSPIASANSSLISTSGIVDGLSEVRASLMLVPL